MKNKNRQPPIKKIAVSKSICRFTIEKYKKGAEESLL